MPLDRCVVRTQIRLHVIIGRRVPALSRRVSLIVSPVGYAISFIGDVIAKFSEPVGRAGDLVAKLGNPVTSISDTVAPVGRDVAIGSVSQVRRSFSQVC